MRDKYKIQLKKDEVVFDIERDNQLVFLNQHKDGDAGKEEMQTFSSLEEAEKFVNSKCSELIKIGFRVVFDESGEPIVIELSDIEASAVNTDPLRKHPKSGTKEDMLDNKVVKEIERLGGKVEGVVVKNPEVVDNYEVPTSLMVFFKAMMPKWLVVSRLKPFVLMKMTIKVTMFGI